MTKCLPITALALVTQTTCATPSPDATAQQQSMMADRMLAQQRHATAAMNRSQGLP